MSFDKRGDIIQRRFYFGALGIDGGMRKANRPLINFTSLVSAVQFYPPFYFRGADKAGVIRWGDL